jgi:hypothetical protein
VSLQESVCTAEALHQRQALQAEILAACQHFEPLLRQWSGSKVGIRVRLQSRYQGQAPEGFRMSQFLVTMTCADAIMWLFSFRETYQPVILQDAHSQALTNVSNAIQSALSNVPFVNGAVAPVSANFASGHHHEDNATKSLDVELQRASSMIQVRVNTCCLHVWAASSYEDALGMRHHYSWLMESHRQHQVMLMQYMMFSSFSYPCWLGPVHLCWCHDGQQ